MKAFLNWSGGKDSSFCLYKAQKEGIPVEALVTTMNKTADRISMHGVRRVLLEQQAASIQLPLHTIELGEGPGMLQYEEEISSANKLLRSKGFTHVVSGDLFLEDLKKYREELYAKDKLDCLFPLWKINTSEMLPEFLAAGFKALIVCVNTAFLDKSFCGRLLDESFIKDLPAGVDPCGENGEYHSFVFDGPIFMHPVPVTKGEVVYKEYAAPKTTDGSSITPAPSAGFYYCDLLPADR
jgi:uncharacterized protein (TIGR00290 family)